MKKDILNKKDIEKLVNLFYEKVKKDPTISHFFMGDFKWDKHLEIMYKFWENVVFYTGSYIGNPMDKHSEIHAKTPLTMKDFHQWIKIFNESVDELFCGEKADLIKLKASNIATVMQMQILKG
ncbi:MAG: group III truncated hemoglobin [Sphingobacteriaceae bacterium]|nr:group III truncated hemoglobin [Sphingobacteriaceae bacterium]MBP8032978.1 group III truncated hemoglobin [Bacteroidia bacterium]